MSTLTFAEKTKLERLFGMESGYVLNFTDFTFGEFFSDTVGISIHSPKYQAGGSSKAKKLREFWKVETDPLVGKALAALIDHCSGESEDTGTSSLTAECRTISRRLIAGGPQLGTLKEAAKVFDARYLADQIRRMEESIDSDPALAIGTAKELIETTCKTILEQRGKPVTGTPDIPILTKDTLKDLRLVPEGIPEAARGSDVIKKLLSNLGTIGNGLAELRGLYGTGHGKHGKSSGLSPRHARLAVGCAAALCTFLFETHRDTNG